MSVTTLEDTPLTITLNGFDPPQNNSIFPLEFSVFEMPAHGNLIQLAPGPLWGADWLYTPATNFNGTDSFIFGAWNGIPSAYATVTITVTPAPDHPTAVNDTNRTASTVPVIIPVLANDYNPDALPIGVQFVSQPAHGTTVNNGDGTVTYVANQNFVGTDTFTYVLLDNTNAHFNPGTGHYYEAVPAPGITWSNAVAYAAARSLNGLQGYLATVTSAGENAFIANFLLDASWLGGSDVDVEGDWRWVTGPEAGMAFWSGTTNGTPVNGAYVNWALNEPNNVLYIPAGEDYLEILAQPVDRQTKWNDMNQTGQLLQNYTPNAYVVEYGGLPGDALFYSTGVVTVVVSPMPHAPVATNQSLATPENTVLPMTLTASDADGDPLTYSIVTPPAHGLLSGTSSSRTYTPDLNYVGTDAFVFQAMDPSGRTGQGRVSMNVFPPAPVPCPDNVVQNPGFESGLGYWSGYGGATITSESGIVHNGATSVHVTGRTANWNGVSQRLEGLLQDATTYIFSGWMYVESASRQPLSVALQIVDNAGTANYTMNTTYASQTDGWVQIYGGLPIQFSGVPTVIRLSFSGPPAGVNFYLDEVDVRCISLPVENNLLKNGGFELGTVNWYNWDGSGLNGLLTSNSPIHGGLRSLECINRTVTYAGPGQELTGVLQANSNYLLTAWVQIQGTAAQTIQASLFKTDTSGTTYTPLTSLKGVTQASGWVQLQTTFAFAVSGSLSRLALYFEGPAAGVNYFVDDVSIVPWSGGAYAEESFSYVTGSTLAGQAGGVGFNGTWGGGANGYTVNSPSLAYPGLVLNGGCVSLPAAAGASFLYRNLLTPLGAADTTRYLSFLIRPDAGTPGAVASSGWFGLNINGSSGTLFAGKPGGGTSTRYVMENGGGAAQVASGTSAIVGSNTLLVVRCDFTACLDTFRLYVNPTPGLPEPVAAAVKSDLDIGIINSVTLSGGAAFTVAELRVGSTFAEVVPGTCTPAIVTQPVSLTATDSFTATFSAAAAGAAPVTYQWRKDGINLTNNTVVAGAQSATCMIHPVTFADAGVYDVVVATPCGGLNSTPVNLEVVPNPALDSDGDGMPDAWEIAHGLNPSDPSDAARDDDHDGMTNLQEYLAGTDPHDPVSLLVLKEPVMAAGALKLKFLCIAGRTYSILYKDSLADPLWHKWQDLPVQPADATLNLNLPISSAPGRFFQVVTPAMP